MHLSCRVSPWNSIGLPLTLLFALGWAISSARADAPAFRACDAFDGKFALKWEPVRPDPTHISLEKNPGKLTITTQRGSIHGDEKNDAYGEGIQAVIRIARPERKRGEAPPFWLLPLRRPSRMLLGHSPGSIIGFGEIR